MQSQAGLGWTAISKRYDDGGISGSTTDRPAFQALLADIAAGQVDVVAVYKIDRLSRSLRDFARLIDLFERHRVTFVSVTQQFSTANSMGRLTLNILMSFAEFKREVIGERIRDKLQASRRRGAWTGGRPVLGYDVVAKKLVVHADEADQVRAIFHLYLEVGSLREVVATLKARRWANKSFIGRHGREITGRPFTKATLHALLTNVLYRGQIRCSDKVVAGQHAAIVDSDLWNAVQAKLRENGRNGGAQAKNKTGAVLRGILHCGRCDSTMTHTFTTRGSRRHRYYVCARAHNEGSAACPNARVPAGRFESFVASRIAGMGRDSVLQAKTAASVAQLAADQEGQRATEQRRLEQQRRRAVARDDDVQAHEIEDRLAEVRGEADAVDDVDPAALRAALASFQPVWGQLFPAEQERILRLLIERIVYHPDDRSVDIELRPCGIDALASEASA